MIYTIADNRLESFNMNNRVFRKIIFFSVAIVSSFLCMSHAVFAVAQCNFSKNLQVGTINEDVRCLQKYLNATGYTVAKNGVGSVGRETNIYGELTKQAVKKWQYAQGISASGMFGPLSREKYAHVIASITTPSSTSSQTSATITTLQAKVSQLRAQIETLTKTAVSVSNAITQSDARTAIRDAQEIFNDAEDRINAYDKSDIGDAKDIMNNATSTLRTAQGYYTNGLYAQAFTLAHTVADLVANALNEAKDPYIEERQSAQRLLDGVRDAIEAAYREVRNAIDDNRAINNARDVLDKANNKLDDARRYFKNKDYTNTTTAANQALVLATNSLKEIKY